MTGDEMLHRALALEERLRADTTLAQQACSKAMALRDGLRQAAEVRRTETERRLENERRKTVPLSISIYLYIYLKAMVIRQVTLGRPQR
jgi:hypothetical protein